MYFDTPETWPVEPNQLMHSMARLDRHPLWEGSIERMRIVLPLRSAAEVGVDSFFTVYDTRHTINNPILILASRLYFGWTGDVGFLRQQINRLRLALRFQQTVMGGLDHSHIVVPWVGHDGRSGLEVGPDGAKTYHPGRGIGNNYWDLLPFRWSRLVCHEPVHASLLALAELEEAIREHPSGMSPWALSASRRHRSAPMPPRSGESRTTSSGTRRRGASSAGSTWRDAVTTTGSPLSTWMRSVRPRLR